MTQTQQFSFFLMPEFTHIAFSSALVPLRIANLVSGRCADRLFLISGLNVQTHTTPKVLNWLRRERAAGTPLGAICSAAI